MVKEIYDSRKVTFSGKENCHTLL